MMFTLTIKSDNAGMTDAPSVAVADALERVRSILAEGTADSGTIRDVNGNRVGEWELRD